MHDVIFLHPPVTRDIRLLSRILYGKPKNLVEYPIVPMGVFSMASLLQSQGHECAIVNLGLEKILNPSLNLRHYVNSLSARIFAVDLHWFTHSDGAIYVAKLCKNAHPDSIVVMGGYTATFFDEEILRQHRCVDFIIRGEGEIAMLDLAKSLSAKRSVSDVNGLAYLVGGQVKRTPLQPPHSIDGFEYARLDLMEKWKEYLRCRGTSTVHKLSFWLTVARGCPFECAYCGGALSCYRLISGRETPIVRKPEKIAEDFEFLASNNVEWVRLSHDPEVFGTKFYPNLFRCIRERGVDISAYWESFRLPSEPLIKEANKTFRSLSIAISPESAIDETRARVRRAFRNKDMFKALELLGRNDVSTDVYFLVGLPFEDRKTTEKMIDLARRILAQNNNVFVQPPFPYTIDPNCHMAIEPKKYGIRLLFKTFEDYRDMCTKLGWHNWIGHETDKLSRKEITELTRQVHNTIIEFYKNDFAENFARRSRSDG